MIVKVQLSRQTSAASRQVLVYDEAREFTYQGDASAEILELMGDRDKAFFDAEAKPTIDVGTRELSYALSIGAEAPWQEW